MADVEMSDADTLLQGRVGQAWSKDTQQIWRVWRTVHEMLRDRGYEVSDSQMHMSLEDFAARFSDQSGEIQ